MCTVKASAENERKTTPEPGINEAASDNWRDKSARLRSIHANKRSAPIKAQSLLIDSFWQQRYPALYAN